MPEGLFVPHGWLAGGGGGGGGESVGGRGSCVGGAHAVVDGCGADEEEGVDGARD